MSDTPRRSSDGHDSRAVDLPQLTVRLGWNTALALASAGAVMSVAAGTDPATAALRGVVALMGLGLLTWALGTVLASGQDRLAEEEAQNRCDAQAMRASSRATPPSQVGAGPESDASATDRTPKEGTELHEAE